MLKDVTLGQFFPGNSILHRLDPRIKIIAVILFIIAVFTAKSAVSYGFLVLLLVGMVAISKISIRTVAKSIKPLLIIIIFTAVTNIFWTKGENLLWKWKSIEVYAEGLRAAALMVTRLITLITGTFVLLTYTTSPMALTDAIERLTSPLKKLGVPTHEFAMMMTIALRFIPTLIEETDKIISAQKSRGADFETGSLLKRAKAIVPILIPLFISAFRRADELASAMECRLYHGGEGRTKMKILKLHAYDFAALLFFVAVIAVTLLINKFLYI
ncbi:MAG: energy-coupling factor transporter transmembrane protein EcfT [Clostridia bacterium]|nr:energy-coupling factor transporter transmembrane protein EcfT [Clostridia bacterium]